MSAYRTMDESYKIAKELESLIAELEGVRGELRTITEDRDSLKRALDAYHRPSRKKRKAFFLLFICFLLSGVSALMFGAPARYVAASELLGLAIVAAITAAFEA